MNTHAINGDGSMEALLNIQNLKTYFSTHRGLVKAVDGVSFYVDKKEIIGLVGESGCGKSVTGCGEEGTYRRPGAAVVCLECVMEDKGGGKEHEHEGSDTTRGGGGAHGAGEQLRRGAESPGGGLGGLVLDRGRHGLIDCRLVHVSPG